MKSLMVILRRLFRRKNRQRGDAEFLGYEAFSKVNAVPGKPLPAENGAEEWRGKAA